MVFKTIFTIFFVFSGAQAFSFDPCDRYMELQPEFVFEVTFPEAFNATTIREEAMALLRNPARAKRKNTRFIKAHILILKEVLSLIPDRYFGSSQYGHSLEKDKAALVQRLNAADTLNLEDLTLLWTEIMFLRSRHHLLVALERPNLKSYEVNRYNISLFTINEVLPKSLVTISELYRQGLILLPTFASLDFDFFTWSWPQVRPLGFSINETLVFDTNEYRDYELPIHDLRNHNFLPPGGQLQVLIDLKAAFLVAVRNTEFESMKHFFAFMMFHESNGIQQALLDLKSSRKGSRKWRSARLKLKTELFELTPHDLLLSAITTGSTKLPFAEVKNADGSFSITAFQSIMRHYDRILMDTISRPNP